MRNKSARQRGKKKLQYHNIKVFEHNGMKIYDKQGLESLEENKAANMQTWCQKDLETL